MIRRQGLELDLVDEVSNQVGETKEARSMRVKTNPNSESTSYAARTFIRPHRIVLREKRYSGGQPVASRLVFDLIWLKINMGWVGLERVVSMREDQQAPAVVEQFCNDKDLFSTTRTIWSKMESMVARNYTSEEKGEDGDQSRQMREAKQARAAYQPRSQLGLVFDLIWLKHKRGLNCFFKGGVIKGAGDSIAPSERSKTSPSGTSTRIAARTCFRPHMRQEGSRSEIEENKPINGDDDAFQGRGLDLFSTSYENLLAVAIKGGGGDDRVRGES
ncbi:hypothetical protein DFJ73DRAFT_760099 [Zopfochytrium polystomum]|nr:hypothetical protein DFJ73DRAFT_760099 [Zopfochytrium polystomum]